MMKQMNDETNKWMNEWKKERKELLTELRPNLPALISERKKLQNPDWNWMKGRQKIFQTRQDQPEFSGFSGCEAKFL